ncbi:MAG TPA: hypothetical protein VD736_07270 [Nitrososphaera sp.]|nr:hypothetical protein [Nitrososphaera sp.]
MTSVNNENNSRNSRQHPIIQRLFFSDERVLVFSAMYGFAAGIIFMIAASTGQSNIANAALVYNYPTIVILLMYGGMSVVSPLVEIVIWTLVSAGVWTLVAFFFYGIFKMFKIARQMEENQKRV